MRRTWILGFLVACGVESAFEGDVAGECADGADNDADGMFDCFDPDCDGSSDCGGETTTPAGGTPTGTATGATAGTTTGTTAGSTTGTPGGTFTTFVVLPAWTDNAGCADEFAITIQDPLGTPQWNLGMAEGAGTQPWTGEDCLNGYAGYNYCHRIAASHVLTQVCTLPLIEGAETLFDASKDPFLTYYLASQAECFVWGYDVSYYASLGCDQLI